MSNSDNVVIAGSVGGATITSMILSSDTVQNTAYMKNLKNASSNFSKSIVSQIKASKVGQAGTKAVQKVAGTQVGKAAGKAAGKVAASALPGPAIDVVMGGIQIASSADEKNVSAGRKAYNITGDVVGIGANIAAGSVALVGGPIAAAIIVFQVCGAILDAAWNPFKNYFNSDLETMRLDILESLKAAYKEANLNYPIETKPDILAGLNDPNSKESKEYLDIIYTYLQDRGLISSEEVRAEEEYFLALKTIKRQRKLYRTNENGELEMKDPDLSAIALFDSAINNDLIMMALAAKYAKNKQRQAKPEGDLADLSGTTKTNYIIGAFIISVLFLIFFFLSIFIASV
jgi:hypothetical protein